MIIQERVINPEEAQQILDNKTDPEYREHVESRMQQSLVDEYSTLIKNGEWDKRIGIVILYQQDKLRTDDFDLMKCDLFDGHHRMTAVAKSGTPASFQVAFLDEEDLSEYMNYSYPRTCVHAVLLYARMKGSTSLNMKEFFWEHEEICQSALYAREKDNAEYVDFGNQKRPLLRKKFVLACLHYLFMDGELEKSGQAKEFLGGLCFDKNPSSEILKIREYASSAENEDVLIKCKYLEEEWKKWIARRVY